MSGEITQQIFEDRCNEVHNNFYDYSKTVYKGMHIEVTITCPIHGDFVTKPVVHYHQKSRCPQCTLEERRKRVIKNKEEHIQKNHKGKYSITCWDDYENLRTLLPATCTEHGEYITTTESIIRSPYGNCPRCKQLLEAKSFRVKAEKIHKDKYIFEDEDYICSRTKMKFVCRKHNHEFYQRPSAHLQNQGCPLCGLESSKEKMTGDYSDFVERSRNIYGNIYQYTDKDYINLTTPCTVICPKHGEFKTTPNNHFMGSGCTECGKEDRRIKNQENFLSKMSQDKRYTHLDFSKVYYVNNRQKVLITCKLHNKEFYISPNKLTDTTRTCGCPICGKISANRWSLSGLNKIPNIREKDGYFYTGKLSGVSGLKLGITGDLEVREGIYKRDLAKYDETTFNYSQVLKKDYYTCAVIETVLKKVLVENPSLHGLDFGGKNEVFLVEGSELIKDIFEGKWDFYFDIVASKVTSNQDDEIASMVNLLKGKYGK